MFGCDAPRGQSESRRRYACYVAMMFIVRRTVCSGAIEYESSLCIGLFFKIAERSARKIFDKSGVPG
jgi:hypothetical protein